jgi:hypothetical protein
MIAYPVIQKSQLEVALGLDAEYSQLGIFGNNHKVKNARKVEELVSDMLLTTSAID